SSSSPPPRSRLSGCARADKAWPHPTRRNPAPGKFSWGASLMWCALWKVLLLTLGGYGDRTGCCCLRVEVLATLDLDRTIAIELVDQRHTGRQVQLGDVLIGDLIQVLDQRAQGVAVRDDEGSLRGLETRLDLGLVVRDKALDDVLPARRARALRKDGVGVVGGLRVLASNLDLRRRGVVAATPGHELLLAVLVASLCLVQALQRTVVPLVEAPVALHRDPVAVRLVQRDIRGHDRAAQQRGEQDGRLDGRVPNQLASALGLG